MTEAHNAPIYAISTSVGSGKTRAAIDYLCSPEAATQNFLYVAPTIRLINQTAADLRSKLESTPNGALRNVHLIHTESRHDEDIPTSVETLAVINEAAGNLGKVVIITTKTFLSILPAIAEKGHWRVILDEAFSPVSFLPFHLGSKAADNWSYFCEIFSIDRSDNYRVLPAPGKTSWVEEIASGNVKRSGQKYQGLQSFAAAVGNPALRCELVPTQKTRAFLDDIQSTAGGRLDEVASGTGGVLLIASYVTPEHFLAFREVIFMSALFEQTMLYHLWKRVFGIRFDTHPWFSQDRLRDVHREQGRHVAVGHLLHKDDKSSKHNLFRNRYTAAPDEREQGLRVVDQAVKIASEYFQGSPFLLQTNKASGYESGAALLPENAIPIPPTSHGLNEYQDCNHVAALAVTNPIPQEAEWIMQRTGLTFDETLLAYRIHTVYQAVGRSAIRKANPTADLKIFLTAGYDDARMLHELFEGSTWLGQIGDLESMSKLTKAGREGGLILETANMIREYLSALPEDVRVISSRALKAAIAPDCKGRTWSKASAVVSRDNMEWAMERQSFIRRDYGYFFDEPERLAA